MAAVDIMHTNGFSTSSSSSCRGTSYYRERELVVNVEVWEVVGKVAAWVIKEVGMFERGVR